MPICLNCTLYFPNAVKIDGVIRNLQNRKYCLECSPFGSHNTKTIHIISEGDLGPRSCSKCKLVKPPEEFYSAGNKLHSWCKACNKSNAITRQKAIKAQCVAYKGGKCEHCGLVDDPCIYDFHHSDPSQKGFTIARFSCRSLEMLKPELDKCLMLCSNCHRKYHST